MKCIIVDDEPIARKGIRSLIARVPELELMEMFNNASSAATYLTSHPVDLVFLDVQMPGITGIEFARNISKDTLIIFQLENHVIFQSLDKKNILEIYLEITAFGFHKQVIILHFLDVFFFSRDE